MMILNKKGFSLIELSIVVTIVAVVAATTVNIIGTRNVEQNSNDTKDRLEIIAKAIKVYASVNDKIPCPADITMTLDDEDFGIEDCEVSEASEDTGDVIGGMVPVINLGLETEYAFDEWGRRIIYVVDKDMNTTSSWNSSSIEPNIDVKSILSSGLEYDVLNRTPKSTELGTTVTNCTGGSNVVVAADGYNTNIPLCAAFLLLSNGQNGGLGVDSKGGQSVLTNAAIIGTHEQENAIFDLETPDTSFDNKFIDKNLNNAVMVLSSGSSVLNTDYFDDVILYRTKQQIKSSR